MAIRMYLSAFRPPLLGLDRFLQIWPKLTRRQPLRRVKSPRPQLLQHVLLVPQLVLEYRHLVPAPWRRMTTARPDASLPEHLRHLQRDLVLARRRPAVRTSISSTSLNTAMRSAASSGVISNGGRPSRRKWIGS